MSLGIRSRNDDVPAVRDPHADLSQIRPLGGERGLVGGIEREWLDEVDIGPVYRNFELDFARPVDRAAVDRDRCQSVIGLRRAEGEQDHQSERTEPGSAQTRDALSGPLSV